MPRWVWQSPSCSKRCGRRAALLKLDPQNADANALLEEVEHARAHSIRQEDTL